MSSGIRHAWVATAAPRSPFGGGTLHTLDALRATTPQSCPPAGGRSILTIGQARRRAAHPEGSNGDGDAPGHRWPEVHRVAHHPGAAGPERGVRARPAPRDWWTRRVCQRASRRVSRPQPDPPGGSYQPATTPSARSLTTSAGCARATSIRMPGAAANPVIRRGHHTTPDVPAVSRTSSLDAASTGCPAPSRAWPTTTPTAKKENVDGSH